MRTLGLRPATPVPSGPSTEIWSRNRRPGVTASATASLPCWRAKTTAPGGGPGNAELARVVIVGGSMLALSGACSSRTAIATAASSRASAASEAAASRPTGTG